MSVCVCLCVHDCVSVCSECACVCAVHVCVCAVHVCIELLDTLIFLLITSNSLQQMLSRKFIHKMRNRLEQLLV